MAPSFPVVLAQFDFDAAAKVPPLPSTPFFERFLLENPWPAIILLSLLGTALLLLFNARASLKPGLIAGGLLLALAGGFYLTSTMVTTPREQIKQATRELVGAAARVNLPELDRLLSDELTVRVTRLSRSAGKRETMQAVETILGSQHRVREHSILETQATLDGPRLGRTQVRVRVTSDYGPLLSWWRVDWELTPDGQWRARRIEALWIPGVPNPGG
ncbi:MAG: hypothetical protein KJZ65_08835 [Phycisphaerales bacterium]|nr:hypothetical protein [Phycisphaerales bacterium]